MATKHTALVLSAELEGVHSSIVEVEVDINVGLSSFTIVGLADKAVSEARERVSSALKNAGIKPPTRENRRVTVNLAPATTKKQSSCHDVAIALGYLVASSQMVPFEGRDVLFIGELALDGRIRPVPGALNACVAAKEHGVTEVFIPHGNRNEVSLVDDITIYPATHIVEVIEHLEGTRQLSPVIPTSFEGEFSCQVDIDDVKGHSSAKRATAIAAAGGHNLYMSGPPGSGKTMLAQALVSLLPPLSREEALEATRVHSAAGLLLGKQFVSRRPFRAPHHSASLAAIVGGGQNPRPGEISLAHRGVLFLDEIPEFHRDVLEALRQPLESGCVVVSRSKTVLEFPARFMFVAASNPCPCGYWGDETRECVCGAGDIARYQKKLSGPLLDRIDLQLWVDRVTSADLSQHNADTGSMLRAMVARARMAQRERYERIFSSSFTNAHLSSKHVREYILCEPSARALLEETLDKARISARGYFKILKVARTIADMEGAGVVGIDHVREAFSYRMKLS